MKNKITIADVIAYSLDAQFNFNGEYSGPHRDIEKNIKLISKILYEFGYTKPTNKKED